jgi:hypothetical protein
MSSKAQEGREVKLEILKQQLSPKTFKVYEIDGMAKVLKRIESSNPKISMSVDYWLNKNLKELLGIMKDYVIKQEDVLKKHTELFTDEAFKDKEGNLIEFVKIYGKDKEDWLLRDGSNCFKLAPDNKLDYIPQPMWDLEIPSKLEDGEPTFKKVPYNFWYKSETSENECQEELEKLAQSFDFSPFLYKLKEEHLEGVNVIWASGAEENLSQFKSLLYDNLIG